MSEPITAAGLTVRYGRQAAVEHVDLVIPPQRITALVGPNGCGKSTLLRALRRLQASAGGTIEFAGKAIGEFREKELARRMALLAQAPSTSEDMTVHGLVRLGRFPHQSFFSQWTEADERAVDGALRATGLQGLRERRLETLSGGQRQRAWIAMVIAQETPVIFLDEPINHLDVAHQLDCLELVQRLRTEEGRTIVVVLHDLNIAARYADQLVVMRAGRVHASGAPEAVLTEGLLREAFGIKSRIIRDPVFGKPFCIPIGAASPEAVTAD